ncbi:MAG: nitroreductase family protein [Candidatus Methanoperedens sp.]|nr:nitroreductase family protein [Candidatus Methanoperedens sp.]
MYSDTITGTLIDLATRDHRLEKIKNDDIDKWYARLEAGFVAGNILLQGSAMGVGSWFTGDLSDDERKNVREFTGIKAVDVPLAIVSIGYNIE